MGKNKKKALEPEIEITQFDKPTSLSTKELAIRWGKKPKTLEVWRMRGQGPKFFPTGDGVRPRIRYLIEEVERYERDNQRQSTKETASAKKSRTVRGQRGKAAKKK